MSSVTDFIAELIRAANEIDRLGDFEKRRLIERAVIVIGDLRRQVGIPSGPVTSDGLIDLRTAVIAFSRGRRSNDQIKDSMLSAAGMIRDLHIVLDTGTEVTISQV